MLRENQPSIGIVFEQFAPYHVDRCEAVAARLAGRCRVVAVEVATASAEYAWDASGEVEGADKVTLFPRRRFEEVAWPNRLRAEFAVLRGCRCVFVGLPYSRPDAITLSWLLRLWGVRVIAMTDSKYDDRPRSPAKESAKGLLLRAYHGAIVAGRRQTEYLRYLGFGSRPVVVGYDTVSIDRVRREAEAAPAAEWADRPFVFVGRFVAKKNLATLLRAYARYRDLQTGAPRRLRLVGAGQLRGALEQQARGLGIAASIDWPGFVGAEAVSRELANALALCLVSTEEQWGLVVNEAIALGLPVIASTPVGACDALVRAELNGYVVGPNDVEKIAEAMVDLSSDRAKWEVMSARSAERAWLADSERFADAVEIMVAPPAHAAAGRLARFEQEMAR